MFDCLLWGGKGNKKAVDVTDDQELVTINASYPPLSSQRVHPFRQFLTVDGLIDGSHDMGVNGSVTPVDFFIPADKAEDRYISALSFIVGYGAAGQPNLFADGAALTNGSRLFYDSERGEVDIHEGIKSNQDLFRLNLSLIPTAWEVRHVNANNDYGYFITFELTKMGLPFGLKLERGTTQRLVLRIQDDAQAADSFDCIAYGFDRFK